VVVDKTMAELLPVADRCFLLEKGRTIWSGAPADLTQDLKQASLGI